MRPQRPDDDFINQYLAEVRYIAESLDREKIFCLLGELSKLKERNGRLFIIGVGGSAGNASHAVNDFRKLSGIECYAPTDNTPEITARTNDEGWDTVFIEYLKVSQVNANDAILVLSVGGGSIERNISVNICEAIDYSKSKGARVIGIVGKKGGYAEQKADICLVIPEVNSKHTTPHSESFQSVIWHLLVSHPSLKVNDTKW